MRIIQDDVFDGLPEDVQNAVDAQAVKVDDEKKVAEINEIANAMNDENNMDADMSDEIKYGDEDEYSAKMDKDGRMAELPESKKNSFKSFDESHEAGNAFIKKMSEMPEKDKVEAIPTNKKAPDMKKAY